MRLVPRHQYSIHFVQAADFLPYLLRRGVRRQVLCLDDISAAQLLARDLRGLLPADQGAGENHLRLDACTASHFGHLSHILFTFFGELTLLIGHARTPWLGLTVSEDVDFH